MNRPEWDKHLFQQGIYSGLTLITIFGLLLALIFVIGPCLHKAQAADPWGTQDIALEATWQLLHLLDWGQTLDIADHPEKYHEHNPIMGKHPSRSTVNLYMGAWIPLHIGITYVLPKECRPYWQYVTIGVTGTCVIKNFSVGLQVRF